MNAPKTYEATSLTNRLKKYSMAAASMTAAATAASTANADIVFLDLSAAPVTSVGSVETFIDIQGVTAGGTSFSISVATNSYSLANPLAPNSELMIRGVGPFTGIRGNNGAALGYYVANSFGYVSNVGTVGNIAPNLVAGVQLSAYYDGYGGPFDVDTPGVAYFTFPNEDEPGYIYEGWLDLVTEGVAGDRQFALTGIHIEMIPIAVPEPTGMALLCLGAAGIGAFRRRRSAA